MNKEDIIMGYLVLCIIAILAGIGLGIKILIDEIWY